MSLTTDKEDKDLNEVKENGQNKAYLVLSDEEKAKGFVRKVRQSYIHKGKKVDIGGTLLTLEEGLEGLSDLGKELHSREKGYAGYIKYDEEKLPLTGRYIKQDEYDAIMKNKDFVGGCGSLTTMALSIAETYARNPSFYTATFCVGCGTHIGVGEFVWDGTNEPVGS